jgi:hypothetical protein
VPRIEYVPKRFNAEHASVIAQANRIIAEYRAQGYDLTLRQLYYQFVARDLIENTLRSYKRLGGILNDARLAGEVDWDAITDRTRNLQRNSHWDSPAEIVAACGKQFEIDKWADQAVRPEVWIEKDALLGVIEGVCARNDVAYFSCRGYTSQSELWSAGRRLMDYAATGQRPMVIHLGDHDPSGIDMTRDIFERVSMFAEESIEVQRIALNMNQVEEFNPPPNPAKITDSRARGYIARFGRESWELDALDPASMTALIQNTILAVRNDKQWSAAVKRETEMRRQLAAVAEQWDDIAEGL